MRPLLRLLTVLLVAYFVTTTTLVVTAMPRDERPSADAIVVLGAAQYDGRPSAVYQARLDHADALYRRGVAKLIVFTGGNEPGDRFTEGGTGARVALARGVPPGALLVEDKSRTTYENLAGAERMLEPRGLHRVVLVSDPFHMYRALHEAKDVGFRAYGSPTRTSPISRNPVQLAMSVLREDVALGAYVALGKRS